MLAGHICRGTMLASLRNGFRDRTGFQDRGNNKDRLGVQQERTSLEQRPYPQTRLNYQRQESSARVSFMPNDDELKTRVDKIKAFRTIYNSNTINTDYFKIFREESYSKVTSSFNRTESLSKLPFGTSANPAANLTGLGGLPNGRAAQYLYQMVPHERLVNQISKNILAFFELYRALHRNIRIQPNFEVQIVRNLFSLKQKIAKFEVVDNKSPLTVTVKNIGLYRGLQVTRNNNYTTDSYSVTNEEGCDDIHHYSLATASGKSVLSEPEWRSTFKCLARIECEVHNAPIVNSYESLRTTNPVSNDGLTHTFVFQLDLLPPPDLAEHYLNPSEYFKCYRARLNQLTLTNVDWLNNNFALTYSKQDKQSRLINALV